MGNIKNLARACAAHEMKSNLYYVELCKAPDDLLYFLHHFANNHLKFWATDHAKKINHISIISRTFI